MGVLFPAVPLAIVARNFRQRSSAGLQLELYAQVENKNLESIQRQILNKVLHNMLHRMTLVKWSLFFMGLSFVSDLRTLSVVLDQGERITILFLNTTVGLMVVGLCLFCVKTILSTKALSDAFLGRQSVTAGLRPGHILWQGKLFNHKPDMSRSPARVHLGLFKQRHVRAKAPLE